MTKKLRNMVIEGSGLMAIGLMLAFTIPTLISTRDSVVAVVGGLMAIGYIYWVVAFFYRLRRMTDGK